VFLSFFSDLLNVYLIYAFDRKGQRCRRDFSETPTKYSINDILFHQVGDENVLEAHLGTEGSFGASNI